MKHSLRTICGAALLVAALSGCASSRRADVTYHDTKMDFGQLQNVAVLPLANLTSVATANERVRDVLMTMLQASGSLYVLPPGEVAAAMTRAPVANPEMPTAAEVIALGKEVKADAILAGTVREYGELRSGGANANAVSVSLQMFETQTGRVVWSASTTKGGISAKDRLLGGGGQPMNAVTEKAVRDLLDKLFK